ncbi:hypothetical protein V6N13_108532 [Hibiscus sabdariffa]
MPIDQWFILNLSDPFLPGCDQSSWDILFAAIIWNLWCQRNAIFFGGIVDEWGSIIMRSRWLADATRNALAGRRSLSQPRPAASLPAPCWSAPPSSWVKLNCDGAHRARDGSSSWGGGVSRLRG